MAANTADLSAQSDSSSMYSLSKLSCGFLEVASGEQELIVQEHSVFQIAMTLSFLKVNESSVVNLKGSITKQLD